jgi:hypothetical protein
MPNLYISKCLTLLVPLDLEARNFHPKLSLEASPQRWRAGVLSCFHAFTSDRAARAGLPAGARLSLSLHMQVVR